MATGTPQWSHILNSFIERNLLSIFLSETKIHDILGIRYAKFLSGLLLGFVILLKVSLSFISWGFLRVQPVGLCCVVVA